MKRSITLGFLLWFAALGWCLQAESVASLSLSAQTDLLTNILPFWERYASDPDGGFYGELDLKGQPDAQADKGSILSARILWCFSRAYAQYGDTACLQLADRAANYYRTHFIRPQGGVYWSVTASGQPADTTVQTYAVAYGIYALSAHYAATGDESSLTAAKALYTFIEQHLHAPTGGYYERLYSSLQAYNPHIHIVESYTALYQVWPDYRLAMNLTEAMDIVADERFATEEVDYGHRYEASWLLTTAADLLGNANLISRMHEVALRKVHQAMQETHLSGEWWPWCETVLGCVNAWQISGDNRYLERAEEAWKHIQAHYIDTENGDWYKLVRRDGKPVGKKASVWFGPYHNGRVGLEMNRRFGAQEAALKMCN